ncbi:hypothetical protein ACFLRX_03650 [Acidobacteriota bacterium]
MNSKESPLSETRTSSFQRIATLDGCRGVAIFLMTFFHSTYHVVNYDAIAEDPNRLLEYPKIVLGMLGFFIYLGTWNTFFLLVSSIVNTYVMAKCIAKGANLKILLWKRVITGVVLLFVDHLIEGFGYWGFLGEGFRTGVWKQTDKIWHPFFMIQTLEMIAWGIIITSIINYFLLRKKGYEKDNRNRKVYIVLTLIILLMTPLVHTWVDALPWSIPENLSENPDLFDTAGWPDIQIQTHNPSILSWFLVILAGDFEPLFPCLSTAFVGAIIGLFLANPGSTRKFFRIGFFAAAGSIAAGALLIVAGMTFSAFHRPALTNHLLQLGGQLFAVLIPLRLIEFRGRGQKVGNSKFGVFMRRWAIIALTIYALEIFDIIPEWSLNLLLGKITGLNFFERIFSLNQLPLALAVAIYSVLWYYLLLLFWGKFNYKGSFEWLLIQIQSLVSKQKSQRLDIDLMLKKVEWINFKM